MAKAKETPATVETPKRIECAPHEIAAHKAALVAAHGRPVSTVTRGGRAVLVVVED